MSTSFNSQRGSSLSAILVAIGYDPGTSPDRLQMTTASGVKYVPRVPVERIEALGQNRMRLQIVAHTLPPSAGIDGLLGLDFFRSQRLMIDFRKGQITLRGGRQGSERPSQRMLPIDRGLQFPLTRSIILK